MTVTTRSAARALVARPSTQTECINEDSGSDYTSDYDSDSDDAFRNYNIQPIYYDPIIFQPLGRNAVATNRSYNTSQSGVGSSFCAIGICFLPIFFPAMVNALRNSTRNILQKISMEVFFTDSIMELAYIRIAIESTFYTMIFSMIMVFSYFTMLATTSPWQRGYEHKIFRHDILTCVKRLSMGLVSSAVLSPLLANLLGAAFGWGNSYSCHLAVAITFVAPDYVSRYLQPNINRQELLREIFYTVIIPWLCIYGMGNIIKTLAYVVNKWIAMGLPQTPDGVTLVIIGMGYVITNGVKHLHKRTSRYLAENNFKSQKFISDTLAVVTCIGLFLILGFVSIYLDNKMGRENAERFVTLCIAGAVIVFYSVKHVRTQYFN